MPARIFDGMLTRLERTVRGRNAIVNGFELWVGLAAISAGIVYLYDPSSVDQGAVAAAIGHTASVVWVLVYTIAGIAMWYGLMRPSPLWECLGLWLLGTATCVESITVFGIFGIHQFAPALILLALTPAAWGRALYVQQATIAMAAAYQESTETRE